MREDTLAHLRDPSTIRQRAHALLKLGRAGELKHFAVDDDKLGDAVNRVVAITRATYPDLRVPIHGRWRHFEEGGVDRLGAIRSKLAKLDKIERAARLFELTFVSVLTDAGAGPDWGFVEIETKRTIKRSEGLAVAILRAFERGQLSEEGIDDPYRVSSIGLRHTSIEGLARIFQVRLPEPKLVGLEGRVALLRRLGESLGDRDLGDVLRDLVKAHPKVVTARELFAATLDATKAIWPERIVVDGENLGDVWHHSQVGLVPFHKLTQWLTYSLVEPLAEAGVAVTELDELTGLPEYRNGGLLLDAGALIAKSPEFLGRNHDVGSEAIVELRALTVAMLDEIGERVRTTLGQTKEQLPLAAVLQGGTWSAGRAIAAERRPGGGPPFDVISDGTVF
ncbi:MAG: DUF1688 family protein [Polyangiales bacterium]